MGLIYVILHCCPKTAGVYLALLITHNARQSDNEIKVNPRDAKAKLAKKIVKMYHNKKQAEKAEAEFNKVFRDKGTPSEIPEFKTTKKQYHILDLLKDSGLTSSKSEAKRIILGKGVKIEDKVKIDWQEVINLENNATIRAGKRKFVKIKICQAQKKS